MDRHIQAWIELERKIVFDYIEVAQLQLASIEAVEDRTFAYIKTFELQKPKYPKWIAAKAHSVRLALSKFTLYTHSTFDHKQRCYV